MTLQNSRSGSAFSLTSFVDKAKWWLSILATYSIFIFALENNMDTSPKVAIMRLLVIRRVECGEAGSDSRDALESLLGLTLSQLG